MSGSRNLHLAGEGSDSHIQQAAGGNHDSCIQEVYESEVAAYVQAHTAAILDQNTQAVGVQMHLEECHACSYHQD